MKFRSQYAKLLLTCCFAVFLQLLQDRPALGAIGTAVAAGVKDGEVALRPASGTTVSAIGVDHNNPQCPMEKRPEIDEAALDLLAFADWPLGEPVPAAECTTAQRATVPLLPVAAREEPRSPFGQPIAAVAPTYLDHVRGGFELAGTQFMLSFGIERAVYINGDLVATTVLNLKDLQLMAGTGAGPLSLPAGAVGALGIIQNGSGNSVSAQVSGLLVGTIIQNTLDNQNIQNVTTINATVNSLQIMRAMSVQSAVQEGIVNSLRR